ncbi:2-C-methyl-D-erythritol 4-phosphate cytidylyltransferase [Pelistega sp. MC2]|uniref:2-C-methyl-D-erythritol 4-phosphate cytidylyltransferase n=1 Tax=Pelistega sp. MC2 TaxID=1720297 RepID=UPI0008DA3272|nr:2-C-methyl-D-erythritol 4-phosphate cytidylyltransferase [Pelistega sp. MC2]
MQQQRILVLIPAGGIGSRAQTENNHYPKQYRKIADKTMLEHSVNALLAHPMVHSIHIGVSASDTWINQLNLPEQCSVHKTGGEMRADTVLNTLNALDITELDWVLVHDAARPGLPFDVLDKLIRTCLEKKQGGILALPVGDTVKQARTSEDIPSIEKTIPRCGLWLAQTPQMFRAKLLQKALQQVKQNQFEATDEASAMEFMGYPVLLVQGHWRNLKVTWPSDFELMEKCL